MFNLKIGRKGTVLFWIQETFLCFFSIFAFFYSFYTYFSSPNPCFLVLICIFAQLFKQLFQSWQNPSILTSASSLLS